MNKEGYTIISNKIIYDNIPGTYYHLLDILTSMCYGGDKDICYPSQQTLAKMLFCSVRTVQRGIKWLKEYKYILVTRRGSISNLYTVICKVKTKAAAEIASTVEKVEDTIKKVKNSFYKSKTTATFNNFKQRNYNFKELEDQLLGKKSYDPNKILE